MHTNSQRQITKKIQIHKGRFMFHTNTENEIYPLFPHHFGIFMSVYLGECEELIL